MLIISIPSAVLAVASFRRVSFLKPLAIIFISASIVAGVTFYAFGLVAPKPPAPEEEENTPAEQQAPPTNIVNATILAGASAQGNPDFEPDPLKVSKGDGVSWLNKDNTPHTVTSREENLFDSDIIRPGTSWLLDTTKLSEGDHEYFCTLHPHMVGTLTILAGAATGETAPTSNATGQQTSNATGQQTSNATGQQGQGGGQLGANQTAPSGSVGGSITHVSMAIGASVPTNSEFFVPKTVQTTVGSMVTWTNEDTAVHTATSGVVENNAPKPDGAFDSGLLNKGQSFSFVFDKAGEFDYYCMVHPYMTGKITVS
jgi:plastocyanin